MLASTEDCDASRYIKYQHSVACHELDSEWVYLFVL